MRRQFVGQDKGFALATTVVLMMIALISVTTMILILSRTLRLTRSNAEAIKSFYISEAGKSYAMWKLSSQNDGADAVQLAHCLAQDSTCPTGLNESWSFALPVDNHATFTVTASSAGQTAGSANIGSYGQRAEGVDTARRQTKITAFKPTRQLEPNDQTFSYGISVDQDFWTTVLGYVKLTNKPGEEIRAGIHANSDIRQFLANKIEVDGPVKAKDVLEMPTNWDQNVLTADQYRGTSCGWSGCESYYNNPPTVCFGTTCDGYVGTIPMPGFDINSAQPDSFKTVAREYQNQYPDQQFFFTASELYKKMEDARKSGANGGWYETPGPITYVDGALVIDIGDKLKVHGVLVVQGNLTMGVPQRLPAWFCLIFGNCTPSTELVIDDQVALNPGTPSVTGIITTGDINISLYMKNLSVNGLIYAARDFKMSCLYTPLTTQGVIIARNYINSDGLCTPGSPNVPTHTHIYDTEKLHLLIQGPRAINNLTTVYSGHWEEEY